MKRLSFVTEKNKRLIAIALVDFQRAAGHKN